MGSPFKHTAENIRREVEAIVLRAGLLCRVFARGKDGRSLREKLDRVSGKYSSNGRLVQDAIGVRVVLYFEEDVKIVAELLSTAFEMNREASAIDSHSTDQFAVTRHNLVLKIPDPYVADVKRSIGTMPIDTTFEVQLRSVLSEGWHEVDHDLRYKSKSSWIGQDDLSRALNGMLATLETAEWGMRRIFDELAYRHYKQRSWIPMLHNRIRMRVEPKLSESLVQLLDTNADFAKQVFRINRTSVIQKFACVKPSLPVTLDNVLYVWNHIGPQNPQVRAMTPVVVLDALV